MTTRKAFAILGMMVFVAAGMPSAHAFAPDHLALGLGSASFTSPIPEAIAHTYFPLAGGFWLRPGARILFNGVQPESAFGVQIHEYNLRAGPEIGLLWSSFVIPSITLGGGYNYRHVSLETNRPIRVESDQISGGRSYAYLQGQFGVGIPIAKGFLVAEPYVRGVWVIRDLPPDWLVGGEVTVEVW